MDIFVYISPKQDNKYIIMVKKLVKLIVAQMQITPNLWQTVQIGIVAVGEPIEGIVDKIQIKLTRLVKVVTLVLKHQLLAVGDGIAVE